jgi:hypothetical protein
MQERFRVALSQLAKGRGRSARPLTLGLGVTAGAVLASALAAKVRTRKSQGSEVYSDYEERKARRALRAPPRKVSLILPPVLLAVALSGFGLWRARRTGRLPAPRQIASLAGALAQEFRRRSRERQTLH